MIKKNIFLIITLFLIITGGYAVKNISVSPDMAFVFVKGGTFKMGDPKIVRKYQKNATPVHSVTINDFYIGKYEVLQSEWKDIMGTSVKEQRDKVNKDWSLNGESNSHPIYFVSWSEAVEFCNKKSKKEGLTLCYSINGEKVSCNWDADGYRLPTEAEWEYAARSGNKGESYIYSGSNDVEKVAWYVANSDKVKHKVGSKKSNGLGLFDMSGNVYEWCWDGYDKNYYMYSPAKNPHGPVKRVGKVIRGGCAATGAEGCRSFNRHSAAYNFRRNNIGFRIVRSTKK
ncbi:SUMF1/EgtB/PvdO family nonheme iron enzyme [bacterium]|nr:SUMF1/EgtB/PvdO family nonheme iron enzyme [bacterium]